MRHARRLTMVATIALLGIVIPASGAGAKSTAEIVNAQVPAGAPTDAHHSYYVLDLKGGATSNLTVVVSNPNGHSVLANIDGVDAGTAATTGASYAAPGSKSTRAGAWITTTIRQVQLAPGEHRTVAFSVHVPPNTPPGQYLAGLSVAVPLSGKPVVTESPGPNQAGFALSLQGQRIIAVEVDVPGPHAPALTVTGARPIVSNSGVMVDLAIANRGNAFARGRGVLTVGDTNTRTEFPIDTFVAATHIELPVAWMRTVVPGHHSVTVRLTYDGNRTTTWSGTFDIKGALQQQLEQQLHAPTASPAKGGGLPTGWIALAVAVIAAAIAVRMRRRRSSSLRPFGRGIPVAVGARRNS